MQNQVMDKQRKISGCIKKRILRQIFSVYCERKQFHESVGNEILDTCENVALLSK